MSSATQQPPHVPAEEPPGLEELADALRRLLRHGLPLTPATAPEELLALRGVWARAVDPPDRIARVDAADRLLRRQLKRLRQLGHRQINDAPQILFGLGVGARRNLTGRRTKAAEESGYGYHYFRKHLEPKIVDELAWRLHQDSLQYVPRGRKVPPAQASGDTPTITAEDLADPERAEHEIALSRIWSCVYALRADLLLREVVHAEGAGPERLEPIEREARLTLGALLLNLDEYLERWGDQIMHGEAEYNAEALIRLAGWMGGVTDAEARELRWEARQQRKHL